MMISNRDLVDQEVFRPILVLSVKQYTHMSPLQLDERVVKHIEPVVLIP
jgi:hypothetical protein